MSSPLTAYRFPPSPSSSLSSYHFPPPPNSNNPGSNSSPPSDTSCVTTHSSTCKRNSPPLPHSTSAPKRNRLSFEKPHHSHPHLHPYAHSHSASTDGGTGAMNSWGWARRRSLPLPALVDERSQLAHMHVTHEFTSRGSVGMGVGGGVTEIESDAGSGDYSVRRVVGGIAFGGEFGGLDVRRGSLPIIRKSSNNSTMTTTPLNNFKTHEWGSIGQGSSKDSKMMVDEMVVEGQREQMRKEEGQGSRDEGESDGEEGDSEYGTAQGEMEDVVEEDMQVEQDESVQDGKVEGEEKEEIVLSHPTVVIDPPSPTLKPCMQVDGQDDRLVMKEDASTMAPAIHNTSSPAITLIKSQHGSQYQHHKSHSQPNVLEFLTTSSFNDNNVNFNSSSNSNALASTVNPNVVSNGGNTRRRSVEIQGSFNPICGTSSAQVEGKSSLGVGSVAGGKGKRRSVDLGGVGTYGGGGCMAGLGKAFMEVEEREEERRRKQKGGEGDGTGDEDWGKSIQSVLKHCISLCSVEDIQSHNHSHSHPHHHSHSHTHSHVQRQGHLNAVKLRGVQTATGLRSRSGTRSGTRGSVPTGEETPLLSPTTTTMTGGTSEDRSEDSLSLDGQGSRSSSISSGLGLGLGIGFQEGEGEEKEKEIEMMDESMMEQEVEMRMEEMEGEVEMEIEADVGDEELLWRLQKWEFSSLALNSRELVKCTRLIFKAVIKLEGVKEFLQASTPPTTATSTTAKTRASGGEMENDDDEDKNEKEKKEKVEERWLERLEERLERFMESLARAYHSRNGYHNFSHAVDVLQAVYWMLERMELVPPLWNERKTWKRKRSVKETVVAKLLGPVECVALLVAAVGHDVGHPGLSNAFMINGKSPLAQVYSEKSVLENFHTVTLIHMLKRFNLGFLLESSSLNVETTNINTNFKKTLMSSVLATDMAKHFGFVEKLEEVEKQGGWKESEADRLLLCSTLMKCADISNPTRPHEISKLWSTALFKEWAVQSEFESEFKLPLTLPRLETENGHVIGPWKMELEMDRKSRIQQAKGQLGFINLFCKPLFLHMGKVVEEFDELVDRLQEGIVAWEAVANGKVITSEPPSSWTSRRSSGYNGRKGISNMTSSQMRRTMSTSSSQTTAGSVPPSSYAPNFPLLISQPFPEDILPPSINVESWCGGRCGAFTAKCFECVEADKREKARSRLLVGSGVGNGQNGSGVMNDNRSGWELETEEERTQWPPYPFRPTKKGSTGSLTKD